MARRLQFYKLWGRRAEDPFRGLRAGPVRFSPILSLMVSRLSFPETHQATPEATPGNKKSAKVWVSLRAHLSFRGSATNKNIWKQKRIRRDRSPWLE